MGGKSPFRGIQIPIYELEFGIQKASVPHGFAAN